MSTNQRKRKQRLRQWRNLFLFQKGGVMDYEYHINYWAYERDKKDVEDVRPVLAKYCPNTMAFWDRTVVQMDAALKFYEKLQDQLDYNYDDTTGVRKMQDTLREVAEDAIDKFYDNLTEDYVKINACEAFYDELTAHDTIRTYSREEFARNYMARRPDLFPPSTRDMVNIYAVEERAITERNYGCAPDKPRAIKYCGYIIERIDGMPLL